MIFHMSLNSCGNLPPQWSLWRIFLGGGLKNPPSLVFPPLFVGLCWVRRVWPHRPWASQSRCSHCGYSSTRTWSPWLHHVRSEPQGNVGITCQIEGKLGSLENLMTDLISTSQHLPVKSCYIYQPLKSLIRFVKHGSQPTNQPTHPNDK